MAKATKNSTRARTFRIKIHKDFCKGCMLCVEYCPKDCLAVTTDRLNAKGMPFTECVHPADCVGCRACTTVCPDAVIELFEITDEDTDG